MARERVEHLHFPRERRRKGHVETTIVSGTMRPMRRKRITTSAREG
jgi:hypothetical protein